MAGIHTYPGVYIEEIPSGVRTIIGVATSNTAFVDYFRKGPMMRDPTTDAWMPVATQITSWADFERQFGGLDPHSEASYAIQQYYLNGGSIAYVVRVTAGAAATASQDLPAGSAGSLYYPPGGGALVVSAASPGTWGNQLQVLVELVVLSDNTTVFNLRVRELAPGASPTDRRPALTASESFLNLNLDAASGNDALKVVNTRSDLIRLRDPAREAVPRQNSVMPGPIGWASLGGADHGVPGSDGDVPPDGYGHTPAGSNWNGKPSTGAVALTNVFKAPGPLDRIAPDIFNILCIPAAANLTDPNEVGAVYQSALEYCHDRRAFCIVDVALEVRLADVSTWIDGTLGGRFPNGAIYFPHLVVTDVQTGLDRNVGPSGTLAGIYARTDSTRGVWKAPAGVDAVLVGARLPEKLTDLEIGELNPKGINALRAFPLIGNVAWGGRTLLGADQEASEWKYIPIRRLALFLEETLYESTKWVVFEPNDEPLWASIRLNIGAFMHNLFVQGAFQGQSPRDAYFVKCDADTTTQNDRDQGIVNILVGFAPLKPAEFVVIKIQQIAGAIQT